MKLAVVATLVEDPDKGYVLPFVIGQGPTARMVQMPLADLLGSSSYDPAEPKPVRAIPLAEGSLDGIWVFRRRAIKVEGSAGAPDEEVLMRVKHTVLHEEKVLNRIAKGLDAFENLEKVHSAVRERIPESVRLFVWQRDQGQCVKCRGRERLEFDHVIPVALGGSNTERNIQLLCERCNREKGKSL